MKFSQKIIPSSDEDSTVREKVAKSGSSTNMAKEMSDSSEVSDH